MHSLLMYTNKVEEISQVQEPSQGGGDGYLEPIAKRSEGLKALLEKPCPGYFITGSCEHGHRFAKELYCGREWCLVCGEEWSATHQRRFARWLKKGMQIKSMGYFVFTIPDELRGNFRTRKALGEFAHQVQELMKAQGYLRGLRRWHFFGDKSTRYNPHLNVVIDAGYISPGQLDTIKKAYSVLLGVKMADIHYHFLETPGEKVHALKYITRATFRDYSWEPDLALELRGFRNQLWWGYHRWDQEPSWSLDDLPGEQTISEEMPEPEAVASLENGECPRCGKPLDWSRVMPIPALATMEKRSLGAGYWELPPVIPPPELPDDDKQRLYWLELIAAELPSVDVKVRVAARHAERWAEAAIEDDYQMILWQELLNRPDNYPYTWEGGLTLVTNDV